MLKALILLGLMAFTGLKPGGAMAAESAANAATNTVELLPASSPYGEARVIKNIPYTTNAAPRQNFDLYLPLQGLRPYPLVVWIHGGAWMTGSKDWDNVKYLVRHGYAIASIDYRMTAEGAFPVQIQDCNTALNFILAHAPEYGIDGRRFVVGGGSAGGHLALLLGLARHERGFGADANIKPLAILDFFGPTDFTTGLEQLQTIHSEKGVQLFKDAVPKLIGTAWPLPVDKAMSASPIHYITTNSPPVLIVHGSNDDLVPMAQSLQLREALNRATVRERLMAISGAGHDGPQFTTPRIEAVVVDFLNIAFRQK